MNLAVDLGNSFTKAAAFEGHSLKENFGKINNEALIEIIRQHNFEYMIIGAVGKDPHSFIENVPATTKVFIADHTLKYPIHSFYKTPTTLGIDRLAGIVGANYLYPQENCLVIDMGTCITYDIVDSQGNYQGGSISPGLGMKFKALHTFTAKLPFVETEKNSLLVGKDTVQSIKSGVLLGTLFEIEGMIAAYSNIFKNLKTIICGGDVNFFESKIKAPIFVTPELVLLGLNRILQHNVSNQ